MRRAINIDDVLGRNKLRSMSRRRKKEGGRWRKRKQGRDIRLNKKKNSVVWGGFGEIGKPRRETFKSTLVPN